jgi:hypothetical protein
MRPKTKARWIINYSTNPEILIKAGDKVAKNELLLKSKSKKVKLYSDPKISKLSPDLWKKINDEAKGRILNKGELIYSSGGLMPVKIESPVEGLFIGIDEFGDLQIELEEEEVIEITAPVKSEVISIEEGKLILEFEAIEYKGVGLVQGKTWGESDFKLRSRLLEIDYQNQGEVILTENIDQVMLSKAEVMGVVAMITNKEEIDLEKLKTNLPILSMEKNDWEEILKMDNQKREIMLNSKTGRLLIVIE